MSLKYFVVILVLFCQQLFAIEQNGMQVIRVTDVNNELVTGAKVQIEGTDLVFYTNLRGECYIPSNLLRQNHTISVHCISYKSQDISVKEISSKIILEFR